MKKIDFILFNKLKKMYVCILYNNFLDRSSGRYRFEQKMFLPIYSTLLYIDFDGQLILRFVRSTIQNRCYKISTSNIATFFFFFFFFFLLLFCLAERL